MAIHEKELLEALSSSHILASMITPAVLISACGTLIFSTSGRLGRLFDRVNSMKSEVEGMLVGKFTLHEERLTHIRQQLARQRVRSILIQRSLAALYTATALFIASSLAIAFNVAFGSPETSWISTAIALLGGLFLFAASALLLYESRYNLTFINSHIDFIGFLENNCPKGDDTAPKPPE
ncbi:protein of unknown function DUF2721 [Geotalea daltonii FRC-32]|uniref:DUF2721 domain-containing protein n=1 Tax=Geotalea daltonii (strain DSM 22248 / JCM 15807 / FRC-32) TaxID=316067 RepID=B9LZE4_GEODF|nr:DUF2721 domain-containing protein [Geotalea daltonii]ACM20697.1 protein of unknown function DUF2721 [Geotalea daltonii FRC-32]